MLSHRDPYFSGMSLHEPDTGRFATAESPLMRSLIRAFVKDGLRRMKGNVTALTFVEPTWSIDSLRSSSVRSFCW